jgi:hypothetical protein
MRKFLFLLLVLLILSKLVYPVVENKDKPLRGEWDFKLNKIWEKKGAGEDLFIRISQLKTDANGYLYVCDTKLFKIFIFDTKGKFITSFGKSGEGPGELKRITRFYLNKEHLFFYQLRPKKFDIFKKDGIYVDSIPTPWIPRGTYIILSFLSPDKFLGVVTKKQDKETDKEQFTIFNLKTKEQIVIKEEFVPITGEGRAAGMNFNFKPEGLGISLISYFKKDRIYYGVNNEYTIKVVDLKGTLFQDIVLKRDKTKISDKEKEKMLPGAWKKGFPPEMYKALLKTLPNSLTFFNRIWVNDSGYIYVFPYNKNKNKSIILDIFSPQGQYIYRSKIFLKNGETIKLFHFHNNYLYLSVEDEEGEIKIIKYELSNPK